MIDITVTFYARRLDSARHDDEIPGARLQALCGSARQSEHSSVQASDVDCGTSASEAPNTEPADILTMGGMLLLRRIKREQSRGVACLRWV